jgi:opacity protein-like surface antigen
LAPVSGMLAVVLAGLVAPLGAAGQELADLDYEYLGFRGFGFDWGYLWPTNVEKTGSIGLRIDMGYAGPGLRILPHVSYWSSALEQGDITALEDRIEELIAAQSGAPSPQLDLGTIEKRDIAVGVDAQVVWDSLLDLLTYGGLGVTAHIIDGDGSAIAGTFIDDLLDSVSAGFNLHFGMEYPVTDRMRIYGLSKYEVMSDMQFFTARVGWQIMTGPNAPGEGR